MPFLLKLLKFCHISLENGKIVPSLVKPFKILEFLGFLPLNSYTAQYFFVRFSSRNNPLPPPKLKFLHMPVNWAFIDNSQNVDFKFKSIYTESGTFSPNLFNMSLTKWNIILLLDILINSNIEVGYKKFVFLVQDVI